MALVPEAILEKLEPMILGPSTYYALGRCGESWRSNTP